MVIQRWAGASVRLSVMWGKSPQDRLGDPGSSQANGVSHSRKPCRPPGAQTHGPPRRGPPEGSQASTEAVRAFISPLLCIPAGELGPRGGTKNDLPPMFPWPVLHAQEGSLGRRSKNHVRVLN